MPKETKNITVFQNWRQALHTASETKDDKIKNDYIQKARNLRNAAAYIQWTETLQAEYRNQPDYLVIIVGGASAPSQIYPNFARELAQQGKKISIINIDAVFDDYTPNDFLIPDPHPNISLNFIPHFYNSNDNNWTFDINKFLRRNIETIFVWCCSPITYPYNFLKLYKNNMTQDANTPLTYVLGYHEDDAALIANANYINQALKNAYQNEQENEKFNIPQFNAFVWGNQNTLDQPQGREKFQDYTQQFGIIKPTIASITANEIIKSRQGVELTLFNLHNEIEILRQNNQPLSYLTIDFINSLENLKQNLRDDINLQFSTNYNSQQVSSSPALRIATETNIMLTKLRNIPNNIADEQAYKLSVMKNYERNCNKIHNYKFLKAVVVVIAAAVGCIVGAAIGASIGILAGCWTGYGAAAVGLVGLFKGAATGAAIGVACGAAVSGITAGAVTYKAIFPTNSLVNAVTSKGRSM